jgi:hypothetical protein
MPLRIERVSNVVTEKIRNLGGNGDFNWIDLFSRSKRFVRVSIRAEEIDFTRAEVFIGDINAKTRGAFASLGIDHLVHILYADFLLQIRENLHEVKISKDTVTLEGAVSSLMEKSSLYFPRSKKNSTSENQVNRKRWAFLEVQLRRDIAQRGEVFLYDASFTHPNFEMSLEELMSILFVDFIAQLRRGNQQILINRLLDTFYSHDFE